MMGVLGKTQRVTLILLWSIQVRRLTNLLFGLLLALIMATVYLNTMLSRWLTALMFMAGLLGMNLLIITWICATLKLTKRCWMDKMCKGFCIKKMFLQPIQHGMDSRSKMVISTPKKVMFHVTARECICEAKSH